MTTETSLEFVEKLEAFYGDNSESMSRLLRLAKTAALIEEHRTSIHAPYSIPAQGWLVVSTQMPRIEIELADLHEAVRAVDDKIKAGNHG